MVAINKSLPPSFVNNPSIVAPSKNPSFTSYQELSLLWRIWSIFSHTAYAFFTIPICLLRYCTGTEADLSSFSITGNSPLAKAKVILFADHDHLNKPLHTELDTCVSDLYQKGDIILVEGVQAGQKADLHWLVKCKAKNCLIQGWEPKGFKELMGTPAGYDEKTQELHAFYKPILKILEKGDSLGPKEIETLDKELQIFISKYKILADYFKSPLTAKHIALLQKGLTKIKEQTPKEHAISLFKYTVYSLVSRLEDKQPEAFYAHMSRKDRSNMFANISVRNDALCEEIDKWVAKNKRVIVFLGAGHCFYMNKIYPNHLDRIHATLDCHPSVILHKSLL